MGEFTKDRLHPLPGGGAGSAHAATQFNIRDDTFIDDDFAFATRDGLIVELEKNVAPQATSRRAGALFTRSRFNFVMQKAMNEREALPLTRIERVAA